MSGGVLHVESEARYRGLRLDSDEYLALPCDGFRYELVDGVVCMSPSPTPRHQKIITKIAVLIGSFLELNPIGEVVVEVDIRLDDRLVYRPDVVFLSSSKAEQCSERVTVAPDVVVEVVSPDSRGFDTRTKKDDYERFGVAEYWVIDPENKSFVFYQNDGTRFVETSPKGNVFESTAIQGFRLDLSAIRRLF